MLWFYLCACALKTTGTPILQENTVVIEEAQNPVTQLQVIDLSVEFGPTAAGWLYVLEEHTVPPQMVLEIPESSGWFVISDGLSSTFPANGFSEENSKVTNMSSTDQHVLIASVQQRDGLGIPSLPEQGTDLEELKTEGLTMLSTWQHPLIGDFPFQKYLRFRHVEISEGGRVGVHTHNQRPSLAVVLQGDLIEHRGDGDETRTAVVSVAERNGLTHWWENTGGQALIVVFDLVDPPE